MLRWPIANTLETEKKLKISAKTWKIMRKNQMEILELNNTITEI